MKKRLTVWLVACILLVCGCGYIREAEGDVIEPVQNAAVTSNELPLYFRYGEENKLVRCPAAVAVMPQREVEYYAISALIQGNVSLYPGIRPCFGDKTKLEKLEPNGDYLSVTLSSGFLTDTKGPDEESTAKNRSLALWSVVNTVCEIGNYHYVRFYLSENGNKRRPTAAEMGLAEADDETALGPLSRNTAVILTPSNTVKTALEHYANLEWDKLYLYLADAPDAGEKLPLAEELSEKLSFLNRILSDYTVEENYTVSEDGKTAMVQVSLRLRIDSAGYQANNVPVKLLLQNHCWKIGYESFMHILGA